MGVCLLQHTLYLTCVSHGILVWSLLIGGNNGGADAGHFIVVVQFLRGTCMDTPSGVSCTPAPSVDYTAGSRPHLRPGERVTLNVPSDEAQRDCAYEPDCLFNIVLESGGEVREVSELDNEHLDGFLG